MDRSPRGRFSEAAGSDLAHDFPGKETSRFRSKPISVASAKSSSDRATDLNVFKNIEKRGGNLAESQKAVTAASLSSGKTRRSAAPRKPQSSHF